jgi:hypothetical protein
VLVLLAPLNIAEFTTCGACLCLRLPEADPLEGGEQPGPVHCTQSWPESSYCGLPSQPDVNSMNLYYRSFVCTPAEQRVSLRHYTAVYVLT